MPRRLFLALPVLAGLLLTTSGTPVAPPAQAQTAPIYNAPIYVAYPKDGAQVRFDHVIFEGSVRPGATLSLNGRRLEVGPDGLFSEWLPLRRGSNTLSLVSVLNGVQSKLRYKVLSSPPARLNASPARIVPGSLSLGGPWIRYGVDTLSPADRRLEFSFRGSPSGKATFRVGTSGPFGMQEGPAGTYTGSYTLTAGEELKAASIRFLLTSLGGSQVQATAPGTVNTLPGPRFIEMVAEDVGRGVNPYQNSWALPSGLEVIYPRQGVRSQVIGENAGNYLVRLAGRPTPDTEPLPLLEVTRNTARLLPAGTALTPALLTAPELQDTGSHLALRLPLGARIPYLLAQTQSGLQLSLYDTQGDPEELNAALLPDPLLTNPLLAGVNWTRTEGGPLTATLSLNTPQQWGYDAVYDGSTLILQMRRPPPASTAALPLQGHTIVLDPGHGGSETGAAGALRVNEKDIVLDLALQVAALLRAQGANVVLTRQSDMKVPLYNRPLLAETVGAELLISIHANALPDGSDPRGRRGSGVYWTNPQAQPLATSILKALVGSPVLAAINQPGNDGLHPDADLALTRPSTQISVLVETAYLTDPGNLRSLMSVEGRSAYAQAIAQGVTEFYAAAVLP